MEPLPDAPGGKCITCDDWLYFRLSSGRDPQHLVCGICGAKYRFAAETTWSPGASAVVSAPPRPPPPIEDDDHEYIDPRREIGERS